MHHDCQLYYVPDGSETWKETNVSLAAVEWMTPMTKIRPSKIVEVPANWHLDDWPPFVLSLKQASTHGYVDPDVIEKMWKKQFDFFYREYDTFVFPMSIHPQVSGKPQVILMHERIIEYINSHEGVEWVTMEQMVQEFKSGKLQGAVVEGGC
jgi:peptidoglycan/xylan/chitin deacetylase (PgdA/CDA1 family)